MHPGIGINIVLLLKFVLLILFPSESPYHSHTGKVLLGNGGQHALILITGCKAFSYMGMKIRRICNDHRNKHNCHNRQLSIHRKHERQSHNDQDHNTKHTGHLVRDKILDHIHIRSTTLNNITCLVLHVPGKRQSLNMSKQFVAHTPHQPFCSHYIEAHVHIAEKCTKKSKHNDNNANHPNMGTQICHAANRLHPLY